jgi:hypothetical protein
VKRLPFSEECWIEEKKIREYLLNPNHPEGSSKARFFMGHGFSLEKPGELSSALIRQGQENSVVDEEITIYGTKFSVQCHCPTPDEVNPCIRTIWETRPGERAPRLITAYPVDAVQSLPSSSG